MTTITIPVHSDRGAMPNRGASRDLSASRGRVRAGAQWLGDAIVRGFQPPADLPHEALRYWYVSY